jgi:hypothetical protein
MSVEYSKKFQFHFSPTSFLTNFFLNDSPKNLGSKKSFYCYLPRCYTKILLIRTKFKIFSKNFSILCVFLTFYAIIFYHDFQWAVAKDFYYFELFFGITYLTEQFHYVEFSPDLLVKLEYLI